MHDDGADEAERTVSAGRVAADGELDANLRPRSLADFIGQGESPRTASSWFCAAPGARRGHLTTSCSPARPDWARRRWP